MGSKEELIDVILNEFCKDKETIKKNLMLVTDDVILQSKNNAGSVTIEVKYRRD